MRLIFLGQGYPRKLFNLEHFPIYGSRDTACYIVTLLHYNILVELHPVTVMYALLESFRELC